MTLKCCSYLSYKLADDVSCGALCEIFPDCLPPPPALPRVQPDDTEAVAESLERLYEAIRRALAE